MEVIDKMLSPAPQPVYIQSFMPGEPEPSTKGIVARVYAGRDKKGTHVSAFGFFYYIEGVEKSIIGNPLLRRDDFPIITFNNVKHKNELTLPPAVEDVPRKVYDAEAKKANVLVATAIQRTETAVPVRVATLSPRRL
jgi:hypothetical protein